MRRVLAIGLLFLFAQISYGQDKKIDKLEILYDQGYYAKVLRKSNRLLADPRYDYSGLPSFYKSLVLFRLSGDQLWYRKHEDAIDEAIKAYKNCMESEKADQYKYAHYYEIASLKTYLGNLEKSYREWGLNGSADKIHAFLDEDLKGIKSKPDVITNDGSNDVSNTSTLRDNIVIYGKSFIGVKYVWAGSDESGFDCSGFTSYVLKKYGFLLPRTASGQMDESKKVKTGDADRADLVFFGNGNKITHVGLIVSKKGEELQMVHASTSKGVIVTNIEQSSYWKPKLKGVGTFL